MFKSKKVSAEIPKLNTPHVIIQAARLNRKYLDENARIASQKKQALKIVGKTVSDQFSRLNVKVHHRNVDKKGIDSIPITSDGDSFPPMTAPASPTVPYTNPILAGPINTKTKAVLANEGWL